MLHIDRVICESTFFLGSRLGSVNEKAGIPKIESFIFCEFEIIKLDSNIASGPKPAIQAPATPTPTPKPATPTPTPKPTSNQTNITNNASTDDYASWSPDGSKIVFHTNRDGNNEIYTMNADGTNQTNISNNPSTDEYVPSWSPDGTKIVFTSKKIFTSKIDYMQIFTIKLD